METSILAFCSISIELRLNGIHILKLTRIIIAKAQVFLTAYRKDTILGQCANPGGSIYHFTRLTVDDDNT